MQINSECPHCLTTSALPDDAGSPAPCPHCQKPVRNSNLLVVSVRPEPQGLRFDMESILALSAFALIAVVAVLFYSHFHG